MTDLRAGDRVTVHDGTRRTLGTIAAVIAGRILVIRCDTGPTVRKLAL